MGLVIEVLVLICLRILQKLGILAALYTEYFAKLNIKVDEAWRPTIDKPKRELFQEFNTMAKESTTPLKVLDIGTGSGPNFEYQPKGCDWTCFEPNEHYHDLLHENAEKYLEATAFHVVKDWATDLKLYDDNTFDVVVTVKVLCSVDKHELLLRAIHRVLKPGGKLFFMEHVLAEDQRIIPLIQRLIDPIWAIVFEGCKVSKCTLESIKKAGFSSITCDTFDFLVMPYLARHFIAGVATK